MKTMQSICVGLLCIYAAADIFADSKVLNIPMLSGSPVIDGNINESAWTKAYALKKFVTAAKGKPDNETTVAVGQTEKGLYIAFTCDVKDAKAIKTGNQKFDRNVWSDDCVEVFLSTDGKREKYYHFMVSADGSRQDEYCSHKMWSFDWKAASRINSDNWTCEIFIPFASIELRTTENLGINFCRNDRSGKTPQASQWTFTEGNFHSPERFGCLNLSQFNLQAYNSILSIVSSGPYWQGDNKIRLNWHKPSAGLAGFSLVVKTYDSNADFIYQTPGVPLPMAKNGYTEISLKLDSRTAYIQPCLLYKNEPVKQGLLTPVMISNSPELILRKPYDGRIFQGDNPQICISFDVLVPPAMIDSGTSLELSLRNVGSGIVAADKKITAVTSNMKVDWKLGEIPAGEYQILTVLKSSKGGSYTLTSLFVVSMWTNSYTRIDAHQRTVIRQDGGDERLFFPIGLFSRYIPKEEDYAKMKNAGFNCIQNYGFMYVSYQQCRDFLDTAFKYDFMVIPSIKDYSNIWPPNSAPSPNCMTTDAINRAISKILAHRDHPAILSWYSADEPAPQNATPEKLIEYYKIIRQADPLHPISIAFCSSGEVLHFENSYDICMPDLYPYPERMMQDYNIVSQYFDDIESLVGNSRAVWATLQAYNKKYFLKDLFGADPKKFNRLFPAYEDIRNMTFQSLICGARGLLYYENYRLFDEEHKIMWNGLRKTVREVNALTDVLLSETRVKAQISDNSENVRGLWLKHGDDWFLLAVNTSKKERAAVIALPVKFENIKLVELLQPLENGPMKMRESSAKIEKTEKGVVLKFLPAGVRVIKMSQNKL